MSIDHEFDLILDEKAPILDMMAWRALRSRRDGQTIPFPTEDESPSRIELNSEEPK